MSWEAVTRALQDGDPREVSDRALAAEHGCSEGLVARVRRTLGQSRPAAIHTVASAALSLPPVCHWGQRRATWSITTVLEPLPLPVA